MSLKLEFNSFDVFYCINNGTELLIWILKDNFCVVSITAFNINYFEDKELFFAFLIVNEILIIVYLLFKEIVSFYVILVCLSLTVNFKKNSTCQTGGQYKFPQNG